jgi:hypothetical protein
MHAERLSVARASPWNVGWVQPLFSFGISGRSDVSGGTSLVVRRFGCVSFKAFQPALEVLGVGYLRKAN